MRFGVADYSNTAKYRGWGEGWPTERQDDTAEFTIATTVTGNAAGSAKAYQNGTQSFRVHKNIAELLQILLTEVQRRGYPLVAGWCWGYENRPISGTQTPSNHSWGLAVDLNAPDNPYTEPRVTDMPSWLPDLFANYGFAWGGNYSGRTDSMHLEYMGTPSQAAQALAAAKAELVPAQDTDKDLGDWIVSNEDTVRAIVKSEIAAQAAHIEDRTVSKIMARIGQSLFNHQIAQGVKLQKIMDKLGVK